MYFLKMFYFITLLGTNDFFTENMKLQILYESAF